MQSSKQCSPDTQSASELEKGVQSFGTEEDDYTSDKKQQAAGAGPGTSSEHEKASVSGMNVLDWDGNDDTDNPYNCMFPLSTFCFENLH